ncbi:MAG TPA: acetate--CoA ligase family protein, partial [Rectinemataceae bacterium]|nr:acetate--CoA ligase family protein [Rectinemataceae bacterium]
MKVLDEYAAREYLHGRGPRMARARLARDPAEAVAAAESMGWPVVAKASVEGVGHKSDFKGVELDLGGPDELVAAFRRLSASAANAGYGGAFRGVLVEERLRGSEFIIGALRDEAFGPVVMVGSGGVLAELFRDAVFRLAPICAAEAERAIRETRASRFLEGFRGSPPLPIKSLAEAV